MITTVFYILVAVAALGIASPGQLAESEAPLVIALGRVRGSAGRRRSWRSVPSWR